MIRRRAIAASLLLLVVGCSAAADGNAVVRGDQAYARGDLEEALAEYRLAIQQGSRDGATLARAAHVSAELGRVDQAKEQYRRAIDGDSAYADQAVADLIRLARRADARNDRFGVSSAIQAALELRPGVNVSDLALPLARHYYGNGEFARALPFFQNALGAVSPDEAPQVMFETAQAYEETGDCQRALVFFEQFQETASRSQQSEASWHIGNCSFQLAEEALSQDRPDDALQRLETTISLGQPRNLLSRAYFEAAEILAERGECEAAIAAFRSVIQEDPTGSSPLVHRAQRRIDEIRFGRPDTGPPLPGHC